MYETLRHGLFSHRNRGGIGDASGGGGDASGGGRRGSASLSEVITVMLQNASKYSEASIYVTKAPVNNLEWPCFYLP